MSQQKNIKDPFYIKVKVKTSQKNEEIVQTSINRFEISIKEKPERGNANKRILEMFTNFYDSPAGGVSIINGQQSPVKLLKIGR